MSISVITELREKRAALINDQRAVLDAADEAKRSLTAEEAQEVDARLREIDDLEADINRRERVANLQPGGLPQQDVAPGATDADEKRGQGPDSDEYRSRFVTWMRQGFGRDVERRDLVVGTDSAGGFTVPTLMHNEIVKAMRNFGVMRQLARVIQTSAGEDLQVPKVTGYGSAAWTAEANAFNESDPVFDQETLSAYKATQIVQVSEELLQDSAFDIESLVNEAMGQNLGVLANTAYFVGDGSGKPTGITTQTSAGKTGATGQTTSIIADDLIDLFHSVLPGYRANGTFVANDSTIKAIRKLKIDSNDQYLWQPGLVAGQPDTILGRPVYADPDVPAMAASAKSVLFGDFKGYWIRDAGSVELRRLDERYADVGLVGFRGYLRTDGVLVDTSAVKHYANAAS